MGVGPTGQSTSYSAAAGPTAEAGEEFFGQKLLPASHVPASKTRAVTKDCEMGSALQQVSDSALLVAIGRWKQEALAEVYRRHAGAVFALARRVLNCPTSAEEVVQEVFLRLWHEPERFDPGRGSLRSFLLSQAHGRAVDLVRSDSARIRREERDMRERAESGYDVDNEVWDLAVADSVKEAMSALPPAERTAIELAYFGGHSYREVAAVLGAPEGTVKARIRTGLRRLRGLLSEAGIGSAWNS